MKLHQTENTTIVEVVCNHPEDSSKFCSFVIEQDEEEFYSMKEEEISKEIRRLVEEKVNPTGYWHEVSITLVTSLDGSNGNRLRIKI